MTREDTLDVIQAELTDCTDMISGQLCTETAAKHVLRALEAHGMVQEEVVKKLQAENSELKKKLRSLEEILLREISR